MAAASDTVNPRGCAFDRAWLENEQAIAVLRARFKTLTPREREVTAFVVTGRLNKQIAADSCISARLTYRFYLPTAKLAARVLLFRGPALAPLRAPFRTAGPANRLSPRPSQYL